MLLLPLQHRGPGTTTAAVITSSVPTVSGRWEHLCQGGQEPGPVPPCHEGCATALGSARNLPPGSWEAARRRVAYFITHAGLS